MEAVVEFHAFTEDNNKYVVKEFAVVSRSFQCQVIFEPPFDRSLFSDKGLRRVRWLEKYYHNILWEDGDTPYDLETIRHLCKQFSNIYTKGFEKENFLRRFHWNVEEISFAPANCKNVSLCLLPQHGVNSGARCALHSAQQYFQSINKGGQSKV